MDKQDAEDMANVERYEAGRIGADATEAILKLQSDAGATVFRQAMEIARLKAALEADRSALVSLMDACAVPLRTLRAMNNVASLAFTNAIDDARRSAERAAQENGQ